MLEVISYIFTIIVSFISLMTFFLYAITWLPSIQERLVRDINSKARYEYIKADGMFTMDAKDNRANDIMQSIANRMSAKPRVVLLLGMLFNPVPTTFTREK